MKAFLFLVGFLVATVAQQNNNFSDLSNISICATLNNVNKTFANIWQVYNEFKTTGAIWTPVATGDCAAQSDDCSLLNPVCAVSSSNFFKTFPNKCILEAEQRNTGIPWNIVYFGICSLNAGDGFSSSTPATPPVTPSPLPWYAVYLKAYQQAQQQTPAQPSLLASFAPSVLAAYARAVSSDSSTPPCESDAATAAGSSVPLLPFSLQQSSLSNSNIDASEPETIPFNTVPLTNPGLIQMFLASAAAAFASRASAPAQSLPLPLPLFPVTQTLSQFPVPSPLSPFLPVLSNMGHSTNPHQNYQSPQTSATSYPTSPSVNIPGHYIPGPVPTPQPSPPCPEDSSNQDGLQIPAQYATQTVASQTPGQAPGSLIPLPTFGEPFNPISIPSLLTSPGPEPQSLSSFASPSSIHNIFNLASLSLPTLAGLAPIREPFNPLVSESFHPLTATAPSTPYSSPSSNIAPSPTPEQYIPGSSSQSFPPFTVPSPIPDNYNPSPQPLPTLPVPSPTPDHYSPGPQPLPTLPVPSPTPDHYSPGPQPLPPLPIPSPTSDHYSSAPQPLSPFPVPSPDHYSSVAQPEPSYPAPTPDHQSPSPGQYVQPEPCSDESSNHYGSLPAPAPLTPSFSDSNRSPQFPTLDSIFVDPIPPHLQAPQSSGPSYSTISDHLNQKPQSGVPSGSSYSASPAPGGAAQSYSSSPSSNSDSDSNYQSLQPLILPAPISKADQSVSAGSSHSYSPTSSSSDTSSSFPSNNQQSQGTVSSGSSYSSSSNNLDQAASGGATQSSYSSSSSSSSDSDSNYEQLRPLILPAPLSTDDQSIATGTSQSYASSSSSSSDSDSNYQLLQPSILLAPISTSFAGVPFPSLEDSLSAYNQQTNKEQTSCADNDVLNSPHMSPSTNVNNKEGSDYPSHSDQSSYSPSSDHHSSSSQSYGTAEDSNAPCSNAEIFNSPVLDYQNIPSYKQNTNVDSESQHNFDPNGPTDESNQNAEGQTIYNGVVYQGPYHYEPKFKHINFGNFNFLPSQNPATSGAASPVSQLPITAVPASANNLVPNSHFSGLNTNPFEQALKQLQFIAAKNITNGY